MPPENLSLILGRPWAVTGELAEHGRRVFDEGYGALRAFASLRSEAESRAPRASRSEGSIAIIPILNVLTQRGGYINSAETTSSMEVAAAVRSAAADESVVGIVLEIDSPGGEVYGVAEAAATVREARKAKPVVTSANSLAASAAYWLGSQADEVFVTPSGEVGSIGVYGLHEDRSKELEAKGRKVTLVSAGKYKTERHPYGPLEAEALASMQEDVNRYYGMFVADVAKGRRTQLDAVREGFGEGRLVGAKTAVAQGMADRVGTLEDAVRRAAVLASERRASMAALASAQRVLGGLVID